MVDAVKPEVRRRLWLLFFSSADPSRWYARFLRKGFGHVQAAAWYDDVERWVHVNATHVGLVVDVHLPEAFDGRLAQLLRDSHVILRVPGAADRRVPQASWYCVGAVKALLGINSSALFPHGLYRHLLRNGAEVVEIPDGNFQTVATGAAEGRSGGYGDAQSGAEAG